MHDVCMVWLSIYLNSLHSHIHTHTTTGTQGSKSLTGISTPRSSLTTAGISNTLSTPPILTTSTPALSLDQQQFKPLSSIVEAAGLSQVVANLTAGMFSSAAGSAQLTPSLVSTLTQPGSVSGGTAMQVSASSGSQNVSMGSTGVSIGSTGSAGVATNANPSDYSQVQSVLDGSNTLTVSSSI